MVVRYHCYLRNKTEGKGPKHYGSHFMTQSGKSKDDRAASGVTTILND
jgi:hypothetical protein